MGADGGDILAAALTAWRCQPFQTKLLSRLRQHLAAAHQLALYAGDHETVADIKAILNRLPILPLPPEGA